MSHAILLNESLNTVKRLCLHSEDGSATLQHFTRAGRVEIRLTAEELELVRTSLAPLDWTDAVDALEAEACWDLTPLQRTEALQNGSVPEEMADGEL